MFGKRYSNNYEGTVMYGKGYGNNYEVIRRDVVESNRLNTSSIQTEDVVDSNGLGGVGIRIVLEGDGRLGCLIIGFLSK